MRHRRRRRSFDGPLVPLDSVNLIAGIEIRLRQHRSGAESMPRRSRCHLEGLHRVFLHPHVDVGRGHLEVLLGRFGRRVVRGLVAHALQYVFDRRSSLVGRRRGLRLRALPIVEDVAQIHFVRFGFRPARLAKTRRHPLPHPAAQPAAEPRQREQNRRGASVPVQLPVPEERPASASSLLRRDRRAT